MDHSYRLDCIQGKLLRGVRGPFFFTNDSLGNGANA